jgi:hypothetical protein
LEAKIKIMTIQRPKLTEEQKMRFKSAFTDLLKEASMELQKQWDGQIYWPTEEFPIINIQDKLPMGIRSKYETLKHKVKDRSI